MKLGRSEICLSAIEEERFGIRVARAADVQMETLNSIMDFCDDNEVVLLVARSDVQNIDVAQEMENRGFSLMDTVVYYLRNLLNSVDRSPADGIDIRAIRTGEEEIVREIARYSFRGYKGHYHADPRLDTAKCDEAYPSWAYLSCLRREIADEVLVACLSEVIVAFASIRLNRTDEAEIILNAVHPQYRGRGIYRSLLWRIMERLKSRGFKRLLISTQITNTAAQRAIHLAGFQPIHAYYTFHKWLDRRRS